MTDLREHLERTLSGTYAIERELGGGGMSRVFVAEETARRREAMAMLDTLLREAKKRYVSPGSIAIIYLALGDADRAFERAEQAIAVRDDEVTELKVDPRFDALRRDPRYPRLLARMNLTP